jgi:hypothetical protein
MPLIFTEKTNGMLLTIVKNGQDINECPKDMQFGRNHKSGYIRRKGGN